jgi:hypothetical protein
MSHLCKSLSINKKHLDKTQPLQVSLLRDILGGKAQAIFLKGDYMASSASPPLQLGFYNFIFEGVPHFYEREWEHKFYLSLPLFRVLEEKLYQANEKWLGDLGAVVHSFERWPKAR